MVDARTGDVRLVLERLSPGDGDEAVVLASQRLRVVRNLRRVALFPFAWLEGEGAERRVMWSDLRFCDTSGCQLAFGAVFDSRLVFQSEIQRIGSLTRTWPVAAGPGE